MTVVVEFLGVARIAAGTKEIALQVDDGVTFRDIIRRLGIQYPALMQYVIQPDGETLYPSQILNHNSERIIQTDQMDQSPADGDRITLMSILAGG